MSNFYESGKYRWVVLDKVGAEANTDELRDSKINQLFDSGYVVDFTFMIYLDKTDYLNYDGDCGTYLAMYMPSKTKFSVFPVGGGNVKVNFNVNSIEQSEFYLDLVCEGNNLEIAPVNRKVK